MSESTDLEAATEAAWLTFRGRLADHIAVMDDDDVLFVEFSGVVDPGAVGSNPYVQVCAFDGDLVQVEAASNCFLDDRCLLGADDHAALLALGWDEPGEEPGWENYHLTFEQRSADEVAVLLVATLREVYAVPHPAFVRADALAPEAGAPAPVVGPTPADDPEETEETELEGIPNGPEHLQLMVDAALTTMLPDLKHDHDGDISIVAGSSLVFVRVITDRPCVELYAEIVIGPQDLERLDTELVLLNAAYPLWKFARRDELVVMTHEMMALPFASFGLRTLVTRFVAEVDRIAADLSARVGGRLFLDEEPVEDERDVLLTGLLELLHLERVRPATVAGLFGHDRLEIIRQIVRIRSGRQSCDDLDEDVVLTALRKALRLVSDGEPVATVVPPKPRRRSVQEPLLDGLDGLGADGSFDLGWSA